MSIQTDLVTVLTPTFGSALYPLAAPVNPVGIYAVYQVISSVEALTLGVNGGQNNPFNTRLQIDIYAPTYLEAQAKLAATLAACKAWSTTNVLRLTMDFFEPETREYRVMIDLSTWHS
jgi:hypothetical protein